MADNQGVESLENDSDFLFPGHAEDLANFIAAGGVTEICVFKDAFRDLDNMTDAEILDWNRYWNLDGEAAGGYVSVDGADLLLCSDVFLRPTGLI